MGKQRQFSEEEIQMTNKYTKKCSTFLAIKEMQIKTILRFHLIQVRLAIMKKTTSAGEAGGWEPSYPVGGNVN
jgi:hypothetical protein